MRKEYRTVLDLRAPSSWLRLGLLAVMAVALPSTASSAGQSEGADLPEVVARFDRVTITRVDLREALLDACLRPPMSRTFGPTFLRGLVLDLEANRLGIDLDQGTVAEAIRSGGQGSGGRAALMEELEARGLTWYRVSAAMRDAMLYERIARVRYQVPEGEAVQQDEINRLGGELDEEYAPKYYGPRQPVAATVGGVDRTAADVVQFLVERGAPDFLRDQIERIASQKRLLLTARQQGRAPGPEDIERALARIRAQLNRAGRNARGSVPTLETVLSAQGRPLEEYKRSLDLRAQAAAMRLLAPELTDEALAEYYDQNRETFRLVRGAHILEPFVEDRPYNPGEVTEQAREAARERITDTHMLLRSEADFPKVSQQAFAELARKYSDCPITAQQGGDLGFVARDAYLARELPPEAYRLDMIRGPSSERPRSPIRSIEPELTEALFDLPEGTVSDIVSTAYGYHLVRCDRIRYPRDWRSVRSVLYERRLAEETAALTQSLAEKYPLELMWSPPPEP